MSQGVKAVLAPIPNPNPTPNPKPTPNMSQGVKAVLGPILKMDFLSDTDFIASSLW